MELKTMTQMICSNCNEEILSANATLCPYCHSTKLVSKKELIPSKVTTIVKLEKAGRYAEAAKEYEALEMHRKASECKQLAINQVIKLEKTGQYEKVAKLYEDLEMWEKACKIRILKRNINVPKDVKIGKLSSITMKCPHCSSSQQIVSNSNLTVCSKCKKKYGIPKKILDLV